MKRTWIWIAGAAMLAMAAAIAVWSSQTAEPGTERMVTAPAAEDPAAITELRQRAALDPCPLPPPTAQTPPAGPLVGITLPCLGSSGRVELASSLAGRPVLLNLWASWCPPCREELPVLAAYAAQPNAVTVLGVNVQDTPSSALSLLAALGVHYPSVTDQDELVRTALRLPPVLPISLLLRPDGSVERITQPLVFSSPQQVREAIERAGRGRQ